MVEEATVLNPFLTPEAEAALRRFEPIFEAIRSSAVRRETEGIQPHQEIRALIQAGFGALTVPTEAGGGGLDAKSFFLVLTELARADSNVAHALRSHFLTVEGAVVASSTDSAWVFREAVAGRIIGAAGNEKGSIGTGINARITLRDGELVLNGRTYYTTGSLFSDWIRAYAFDQSGERRSVLLEAREDGVAPQADYGGFGQRWSGSGSTLFENVTVTGRVRASEETSIGPSSTGRSFAQLVLLSVIVGAGLAALDDAVDLLRSRGYNHPSASDPSPLRDPIVSETVGEISAAVFAARSALHAATIMHDRAREYSIAYPDQLNSVEYRLLVTSTDLATFQSQAVVIREVLEATAKIFDVAGATAVERSKALDRHWRNVRTVASHNPHRFRLREIGGHHLNGDDVEYGWGRHWAAPVDPGGSPVSHDQSALHSEPST